MRWDREAGLPDQAVLFDLPTRKFFLFDLVIWPQEIFLLTLVLIFAAVGLFFITALAGRVFCGYMCFQTVWTDMFLYMEKVFEGSYRQRRMLDDGPMNMNKFLRKTGKHVSWLLISMFTGGVFVFYFADAPTLLNQFFSGEAPTAAWFTLGFLTLTTYTMAGFAREQVCTYMCPYARFQGAMFDEDTIIVAYHPELGEPRESNRRVRHDHAQDVGWCIDCGECVNVCPVGIDIRNGQQYQCITCGACIDACDDAMAALSKEHSDLHPARLIRYTSMREMNEGEGTTRFVRARILIYGLILGVTTAAMFGYFLVRSSVDLGVVRERQPIYIPLSDGGVQNNFTARILNMSHSAQLYKLTVEGLPKATIRVATEVKYAADGSPLLPVESGKVLPYRLFVKQPRGEVQSGQREVTFRLVAQDPSGGETTYESVFIGP
ncbi:putative 4Fe-4S ferredoxin [Magnetofaba australis IT-1]|uniref:Putative 4Fe-4S ferredoxin n=2 Tax=Magnetofaba TaxID=1472292 RepID=A0A1Y2K3D0_9PROT|nr:putative 4Fe-4S ferredoxin [Magnetofaba australis IT-1]